MYIWVCLCVFHLRYNFFLLLQLLNLTVIALFATFSTSSIGTSSFLQHLVVNSTTQQKMYQICQYKLHLKYTYSKVKLSFPSLLFFLNCEFWYMMCHFSCHQVIVRESSFHQITDVSTDCIGNFKLFPILQPFVRAVYLLFDFFLQSIQICLARIEGCFFIVFCL